MKVSALVSLLLIPLTLTRAYEEVEDGRYSFFVDGGGCSGSLVAADVVLSAAQCVDQFESSVMVGSYLSSELTEGAESRDITSALFLHPDYNNETFANDLMLFRIEPSTLTPIALNSDASTPMDDQNLTVLGYGFLHGYGALEITIVLQRLILRYFPNDECNSIMYGRVDETMFCGVNYDETESFCLYDTGGPIFDEDSLTLMGVVSWGKRECSLGSPQIMARASHNLGWIYETVCNLTKTSPEFCTLSPPPSMAPSVTPSMSPSTTPFATPSLFMAPSKDASTTAIPTSMNVTNDASLTTSSSNSNLGVIVGSVCGGILLVLALVVLVGRIVIVQKKKKNSRSKKKNMLTKANASQTSSSSCGKPHHPMLLSPDIIVEQEHLDDISTLGDPIVYGGGGMMMLTSPMEHDERTNTTTSVNIMNYDYTNQFQQSSSSSSTPLGVSRTFGGGGGDASKHQPSVMSYTADWSYDDIVGGGKTSLTLDDDEGSFTRCYHDIGENSLDNNQSLYDEEVPLRYERIEVQAPAGKLGIEIVLLNNGVPVVHALKSDCILAGHVQVGDQLISVNGVPVPANMTSPFDASTFIQLQQSDQQPRVLVLRRPMATTTQ